MPKPARLLVLLGYAGFVGIATLVPTPDVAPTLYPGLDKIVHLCLFAGLGGIGAWSLPDRLIGVAVGGMMFGLATELGQMLVPTRSFELLDLAADVAGVVLGILVSRWSPRLDG